MPQPADNLGRKPLSRSEAARHASLVRWKKEQPFAQPNQNRIANRVRELLAKKKKGKGGKGKAAKPKLTDEQKKQAKQDLLDNNRSAVYDKTGLSDEGIDAVNALEAGDQPKNAADLIKRGLAEQDSAGNVRLSAAGHSFLSAADKGDAGAAAEALSHASDKIAKEQTKEQAKADQVAARAAKEAEKQAKLKKAAAGGGGSKKKEVAHPPDREVGEVEDTPAQQKQGENRAKVASEMADLDSGLSPGGSAALTAFADGAQLPKETADQLTTMGLLEQDSAGGQRLSYAGRATINAMNRGDTRAALDAISRAADRAKAQEDREKAKADREKKREQATAERKQAHAERTAKEDASRARIEQARIEAANKRGRKAIEDTDMSDELDPLAIKAGARHSRGDIAHLQAIHDSAVACGASCGDGDGDEADLDMEAEKAIKSIQDHPQWYASHECGDVSSACSALQTLAMLIQSELSEQDEEDTQIGMLCDAARILVRFIGGELDELQGAAGELPNSASVQTLKGIELAHLESGEDIAIMGGGAIKSIGDTGLVGGWLVKFGGDGDLSNFRDVFTKETNYGKHTKSDVWVHHRMLPGLGKKGFTNQAELSMENEGVFFKHLLDLRSAYEAKFYNMVQAGKLGLSSGTAPHLVERKALGDGRHEITQWTLGLDASYTPMPAGGFVVNAGAMKSLLDEAGIDLLNALYIDDSPEANEAKAMRHDGAEMDADDRARRLVLELDLLALETI